MANQTKEIVIPDYTFGINQVFDAAFDHAFRGFTGETPSSYRKRLRFRL